MIRFEDMSPEIMESMCTPMHRILPVNSSASPASPSTTGPKQLGCLYLGSIAATMDRELLSSNKITHLVQVLDAPWLPITEKDGFRCLRISILDAPTADLRPHLEGACDFINNALRAGSNVLVHCQQGVSRSSSVVIAYLIHNLGMSYDQAFALVKKRRPCIRPNAGFVAVLRAWESKWRAQVAAAASGPSAAPQIRRYNTSYTISHHHHPTSHSASGGSTPAPPPSTPNSGAYLGSAGSPSAQPRPSSTAAGGGASGLPAPQIARGISYAGPGSTPTFTLKPPPAFHMKHRASAAAPHGVTPVQAS